MSAQRSIVEESVREYATYLGELAELSTLDVWYSGVDAEEVARDIKNTAMRRTVRCSTPASIRRR